VVTGAGDLAALVAAFGHLLHATGVPVTPERSGRFAEAIALARPATVDELYWTGRVTLLTGVRQIETYDQVFAQVFRGILDVADTRGDTNAPPPAHVRAGEDRRADPSRRPSPAAADSRPGTGASPGEGAERPADAVLAAASTQERLREQDFARLTADELDALRHLLAELPLVPPRRPSRRLTRHPAGARIDLRATLRRAHRTGGDPVERIRRRPSDRPRRLVLLADVSGSMEPYARAYLHLLHGAVRATKAEAFVFATRLTRLTHALAVGNPDVALERAARAAPDWSGGTRIGAAVKAFNDGYGRRGLARGAVVVVVSDGWERDDPAVLGEQMARLARLAHRVVWVNPRSASERYEPLAGGMAAALPYVDAFVSGHSLSALDDVLAAIHHPA
jgi:uncharacterized protein with von Willebrand factor type A (vWA) domain